MSNRFEKPSERDYYGLLMVGNWFISAAPHLHADRKLVVTQQGKVQGLLSSLSRDFLKDFPPAHPFQEPLQGRAKRLSFSRQKTTLGHHLQEWHWFYLQRVRPTPEAVDPSNASITNSTHGCVGCPNYVLKMLYSAGVIESMWQQWKRCKVFPSSAAEETEASGGHITCPAS